MCTGLGSKKGLFLVKKKKIIGMVKIRLSHMIAKGSSPSTWYWVQQCPTMYVYPCLSFLRWSQCSRSKIIVKIGVQLNHLYNLMIPYISGSTGSGSGSGYSYLFMPYARIVHQPVTSSHFNFTQNMVWLKAPPLSLILIINMCINAAVRVWGQHHHRQWWCRDCKVVVY